MGAGQVGSLRAAAHGETLPVEGMVCVGTCAACTLGCSVGHEGDRGGAGVYDKDRLASTPELGYLEGT